MPASEEKNAHSQSGRLLMLGDPILLQKKDAGVHIIQWTSTTIKRVCRSTMQAETLSTCAGSEEAQHLRAVLFDCEQPMDLKTWTAQTAASRQVVMLTDCKSLETSLTRLTSTGIITDKRLSIDLRGLRQDLWRRKGEDVGDPYRIETIPNQNEATDILLWIDTAIMLADPLTKSMNDLALNEVLKTGYWNIQQPAQAVVDKLHKQDLRQKLRKRTQAMKQEASEARSPELSGDSPDAEQTGNLTEVDPAWE